MTASQLWVFINPAVVLSICMFSFILVIACGICECTSWFICLNQFALYNKTILFTTNVCYFCSNLAHIIPTTVYLDNIFDLSLFYNESKSEILYTIRLYFILNLHLVSYHTTSKQYKYTYTWPKNIILLFYAFPFQMTYLI